MTTIATIPLVRSVEHIGHSDVPQVGGKGANLGEMRRAGLPVPGGFVVTVDAFERTLASDGSLERLEALLRDLDVDDTSALQATAAAAQEMVRDIILPEDVREEILTAYRGLSKQVADVPVAVRSSATAEDAPSASFAGCSRASCWCAAASRCSVTCRTAGHPRSARACCSTAPGRGCASPCPWPWWCRR